MSPDNSSIEIGKLQEHWNVTGTRILKYTVEMYHKGLREHKIVSAPDLDILRNKVTVQAEKWADKWRKQELKRKALEEREKNLGEATRRSEEAKRALEEIENILTHTLAIDDAIDWDTLKKKGSFDEPKPSKPKKEPSKKYPLKPDENSEGFRPKFTLLDKIFKSRKEQKIKEYERKYSAAVSNWEKEKAAIDLHNDNIKKRYEKSLEEWEKQLAEWERRKKTFYEEQIHFNQKIERMKQAYFEKDADAIVEYCEMVLNNSKYPDSFPKNFELEYNPENGILIIEYQLPSLEVFPTVKEVKYVASRNELKEYHISKSKLSQMYNECLYKIALRTIHEIFEADKADAIEIVSLNGWVRTINKATGREVNNCILSLQVKKEDFLEIDLSQVDPRLCFMSLKGVAAPNLSQLIPVKPILQLTKTDKRFIDSYEVAETLDDSTNIAAMDWQDFEHLIRELFEKEFQASGGEVKITRASRDGGVDAIAFDPDPIRGGKIIIQAKRYTNTVELAAVRDLYGTVVNEGAIKGILVTTADYGADAYEFAKDKPLTLLNGSNLLQLLKKHGHRAKIDIKEAKRLLAK